MKTEKPSYKIVYMSTIPPTQCGIATFTEDTVQAITNLYGKSIQSEIAEITFNGKPNPTSKYHLPSKQIEAYEFVAAEINKDDSVKLVHIQHEFGLFGGRYGNYLFHFLTTIQKPVVFTFHSVLADPNPELKTVVQLLSNYAEAIIVMTQKSKEVLVTNYYIDESVIEVIPHGTPLVDFEPTIRAKEKLGLESELVLSTFGLLGEGKNIETGIKAMKKVVQRVPNALYVVLGKTHPHTIIDGIDTYRDSLEALVQQEQLENNVKFVNEYLPTEKLLEYLKATDVYLFTSKDPNQAVSGTFSYAMCCACPIVASKIPHTKEYLTTDMGFLVDIQNEDQFAEAALKLLQNTDLRHQMGLNAFAKTTNTSWENTALKHLNCYQQFVKEFAQCKISYPEIKLSHLQKLTTNFGVVQFCKISDPDLSTGYTLDDNARALIAMCHYYELTEDNSVLNVMQQYLDFILFCQQENGRFVNYIKENKEVDKRNNNENLEDANGRALWALGTVMALSQSKKNQTFIEKATQSFHKSVHLFKSYQSPRALAFVIKGLYKANLKVENKNYRELIDHLASELQRLYEENATTNWLWFEDQLTYANSILPEALLLSYLVSKKETHKESALEALDFLSSKMFVNNQFKIISNKGWHQKDAVHHVYGEQPIEACYMMHTLDVFYKTFDDIKYKEQLKVTFDWFLGKNHLHHIMYNPVTGGCYDGLEKDNVNLNQGAESTICFLLSRLLIEQYTSKKNNRKIPEFQNFRPRSSGFK